MIICICNTFNEKTVREGIRALAKDLPVNPDKGVLETFYHDVYEWCGKEAGFEGVTPQCFACFDEFVTLTVQETLDSLAIPHGDIPSPHFIPVPFPK